ncbi:MAG: hypothetical protein CMF49_05035 [Legionellales bacterium]|nr:hypothetical protein [Legionellales bacterium]|tara:strand:- start:796 stop:1065 length:270 start_codon:yes stop_codon:yes gene_type:complete
MSTGLFNKVFTKIKAIKNEGLTFKNVCKIFFILTLFTALFFIKLLAEALSASSKRSDNDNLKSTAQLKSEGKYGTGAYMSAHIREYGEY